MTGDPRRAVITRVREALAIPLPAREVPRGYRTSARAGADVVELFAERVADYQAVVYRAEPGDLADVIARIIRVRGAHRIVLPSGLPAPWLGSARIERVSDDPQLTHHELDGIDGVVTGCAVAIAETGTIVLDAGPSQGRRALSLLPDLHICVVEPGQIVGTVAEALRLLDPRRPLTWISGPSATSDIELSRVEGVHGPRKLDVVIVSSLGPPANRPT